MRKRDQEHYEVARKFGVGRPFTRSEFNRVYRQEYPERLSAPLPSDYCVNLNPKLAQRCPKFLHWLGRGRYEFIGELRYGQRNCLPVTPSVPLSEFES